MSDVSGRVELDVVGDVVSEGQRGARKRVLADVSLVLLAALAGSAGASVVGLGVGVVVASAMACCPVLAARSICLAKARC